MDPGYAGYSSLVILSDRTLAILYEQSDEQNFVMLPDRIVFQNLGRLD